ncbi:hypothetical protein NX059_007183 [Plenodomus lindquistii]|nr:hypothetical protein NX059_007183 [Plenodomus lindquistii]
MDIRAWERRASAFDDPYHGHPDEDEGYYEDSGEVLSPEDYEEMLFQRVLDKIRIARAAGNDDVQLSPEELDAYQSKLHGSRTPAARPQPVSQPTDSSLNDTASVAGGVQTKHAHSSSRSKKEKRSSIFSTKSKKDKERDKEKSSHRKRVSTSSSISSHPPAQTSPGFIVPGPDGHPVFAPINSYTGNLPRDTIRELRSQPSSRPTSRSTSGTHPQLPQTQLSPRHTPPHGSQNPTSTPTPTSPPPPRDVLGAFPGSEHTYRPPSPGPILPDSPPQHPSLPSLTARQQAYARERQLEAQGLATATQQAARGIPFPVEMYQYQAFSPAQKFSPPLASPESTTSQPQYVRRVSGGGASEASWTSVPRRVPVPVTGPVAPVSLPRSSPGESGGGGGGFAEMAGSGEASPVFGLGVDGVDQGVGVGTGISGGGASGRTSKDGERKRKSGKGKKRA